MILSRVQVTNNRFLDKQEEQFQHFYLDEDRLG